MYVFIGVSLFIIVVIFIVLAILLLNQRYLKNALIIFLMACIYCTLVLGRTNKIIAITHIASIGMTMLQETNGKNIYVKENTTSYTYKNKGSLLHGLKLEPYTVNIKKNKAEIYFVESFDSKINNIFLSSCTYKRIKTTNFWGSVAEKLHLTNTEFTKDKYVIYITRDSYLPRN